MLRRNTMKKKILNSVYDTARLLRDTAVSHPYLTVFSLCMMLTVTGYDYRGIGISPEYFLVIPSLIIGAATAVAVIHFKNHREKILALAIAAEGFILRAAYVLESTVSQRQNDVHSFGGSNGHAAYIEYIYNNLSIPDVDPTTVWQFYHPPLHHIIAAAWMRLLTLFGMPYGLACESIQALTLFYSCCCIIIVYKILRYFKLRGAALLLPFAITAFHPSMILLSGSINNDILSITLALAALYAALVWYEKPTLWGIIKIALLIGLGMSAKLSAALIAPAVAVIFLAGLIRYRKQAEKMLGEFIIFALICFPLGLWWSVRCFVKYRMPFGFVPDLTHDSYQYIGSIPTSKRLFDFGAHQFENVFEQWSASTSYLEYNPTVGFLKNSLFGERINEKPFTGFLIYYPVILFWIALILALLSFAAMAAMQFIKGERRLPRAALLIAHATYMISYYKFCFDFPYTCTMNFRYIVPTMFIGAAFIGMALQALQRYRSNKKSAAALCCTYYITALTVIFCAAVWLTYYVMISSLS